MKATISGIPIECSVDEFKQLCKYEHDLPTQQLVIRKRIHNAAVSYKGKRKYKYLAMFGMRGYTYFANKVKMPRLDAIKSIVKDFKSKGLRISTRRANLLLSKHIYNNKNRR